MAPFKSRAQARKLWKSNPELARRMTSETLDIRRLPERMRKNKKTS